MRFGTALWLCTNKPLCKHLISGGGGGIHPCAWVSESVCLCTCWLMGSQQGARPTYNLLPPRLPPRLLLPPPSLLFQPRLIWQQRRSGAGAPVTKGHCSSSKDTLMPPFPLPRHLVSLLCPHSSPLPARSVPPPHSFVFTSTFSTSLVFLSYNSSDSRHILIFFSVLWSLCFSSVLVLVSSVFSPLNFNPVWQILPHRQSGSLFDTLMDCFFLLSGCSSLTCAAPPPLWLVLSFVLSWLVTSWFPHFCLRINKRMLKKNN